MKDSITMMQILCIAVMGTDDESEANHWFDKYKKLLDGNGDFDTMMDQLDDALEKGSTTLDYLEVFFNHEQANYLENLVLGENTLDEILEHIRNI